MKKSPMTARVFQYDGYEVVEVPSLKNGFAQGPQRPLRARGRTLTPPDSSPERSKNDES